MSLVFLVFLAWNLGREAGNVRCFPHVWNLRAVIWFHLTISSPVPLPSPITLSACWSILLTFFQKILQYISLRDRLAFLCFFFGGSCLADRRSKLVLACCHRVPAFAVMHLYNILNFLLLLSIPFFKNLVLTKQWNGLRYQRALAFCAFFFFNTGITEGTNSWKILCLMFVYVCFFLYKFVSGLIL